MTLIVIPGQKEVEDEIWIVKWHDRRESSEQLKIQNSCKRKLRY
jgi:hypothetical protein